MEKSSDHVAQLLAKSCPMNQIAKNSYLGAALRNVGQGSRSCSKGDQSPYSSDSGDEGGMPPEGYDSDGSGSETDSTQSSSWTESL